jgi:hypothetical protein
LAWHGEDDDELGHAASPPSEGGSIEPVTEFHLVLAGLFPHEEAGHGRGEHSDAADAHWHRHHCDTTAAGGHGVNVP